MKCGIIQMKCADVKNTGRVGQKNKYSNAHINLLEKTAHFCKQNEAILTRKKRGNLLKSCPIDLIFCKCSGITKISIW